MTTDKSLATEPAVAPGVTPEFLSNRQRVIDAALGTIPVNTISKDVLAVADAEEDFETIRDRDEEE